jgi:hypothetical protein
MHNIYKTSVGYHETGERFDWYCLGGFAVVIDTETKATITGWINIKDAKHVATTLNSLQKDCTAPKVAV